MGPRLRCATEGFPSDDEFGRQLPPNVRPLWCRMLDVDARARPSAFEAYQEVLSALAVEGAPSAADGQVRPSGAKDAAAASGGTAPSGAHKNMGATGSLGGLAFRRCGSDTSNEIQ